MPDRVQVRAPPIRKRKQNASLKGGNPGEENGNLDRMKAADEQKSYSTIGHGVGGAKESLSARAGKPPSTFESKRRKSLGGR